jgi:PIN domain nuclease of toxin-antitoxin system
LIVLDTHSLLWWVEGDSAKLSAEAKSAIETERFSGEILVSSITAWEIALLVSKRRLGLSIGVESWLAKVGRVDRLRFVSIDNEIAVAAIKLPEPLHRDPADRIIVATARHFGAPLVTGDRQLRAYAHVTTIW